MSLWMTTSVVGFVLERAAGACRTGLELTFVVRRRQCDGHLTRLRVPAPVAAVRWPDVEGAS